MHYYFIAFKTDRKLVELETKFNVCRSTENIFQNSEIFSVLNFVDNSKIEKNTKKFPKLSQKRIQKS